MGGVVRAPVDRSRYFQVSGARSLSYIEPGDHTALLALRYAPDRRDSFSAALSPILFNHSFAGSPLITILMV